MTTSIGVGPQAVHDSVVALDDLADGFVTNFGHHSPGERMLLESGHGSEDALGDELCEVRGVSTSSIA